MPPKRLGTTGLKVSLKKTKVMVSDFKDEILKSKVDSCTKLHMRVMKNLMCTKCSKWVHARCTITNNSGKTFLFVSSEL